MSTEVPRSMFSNYFCLFGSCYDPIIVDDNCLSSVMHDGSESSVVVNTMVSAIRGVSATKSSIVPRPDSASSINKIMIWFNFVVAIDTYSSSAYERISLEHGTAEG